MADINIWELLLSFGLLVIPLMLFRWYKIGLIKSTVISVVRMGIQLALVAVYLEWVFEKNNALINTLWVVIMLMVGVLTSIKRVSLNWRSFVVPLFIAGFTAVLTVDAFFLGAIIKLDYVFDARYFIPITGMILGNSLNHNIVGLSTYFKSLKEKSELYQFLLTNTGDAKLALRPFIGEAVKHALNPMIANMSVMGIISLPGMMTGQILGGSSPATAIKYQIMIMLSIFIGCTLNLFLSIILANRSVFNKYGNLNVAKIFKR
ncbi:ABC transporter permease [Puteibacter caeruleilacunae]|nr:ABC transporter permease [Puteibacter caeruleilacunae]